MRLVNISIAYDDGSWQNFFSNEQNRSISLKKRTKLGHAADSRTVIAFSQYTKMTFLLFPDCSVSTPGLEVGGWPPPPPHDPSGVAVATLDPLIPSVVTDSRGRPLYTGLYSGPYFDTERSEANVTAQLGSAAVMPCRVKQAGGRAVRRIVSG